jgi:dienelactone hydrolase
MHTSEFPIESQGEKLTCLLAEPERLAARPALLILLTGTRQMSLTNETSGITAKSFLDAGHRVLSFDLPSHGDRLAPWKTTDLHGFCEAFLAGHDPFERVVADGRAAVDAVLSRGLTVPSRLMLSGVSRGGYCALRLAADEPRIAATAALAPVTDWRALTEFAAAKDRPDVAALDLEHRAARLAGKALFIAIGSSDHRVGTERCARLVAALLEAEAAMPLNQSRLDFHFVHNTDNHRLGNEWYAAAGRYLLGMLPA